MKVDRRKKYDMNAKNRFQWWIAGGPMSLAIWPMIFRLLGRWRTGKKFQNDHWKILGKKGDINLSKIH